MFDAFILTFFVKSATLYLPYNNSKTVVGRRIPPERKYYSVTTEGLEYIASMSDEWDNLLNAIEKITGRRNANNEHCYIQPIGRTDL